MIAAARFPAASVPANSQFLRLCEASHKRNKAKSALMRSQRWLRVPMHSAAGVSHSRSTSHSHSDRRNSKSALGARYRAGLTSGGLARQCPLLHGEIGLDVHVRRRWALVAEPQRDLAGVCAGLQQAHRCRMSNHVWCDPRWSSVQGAEPPRHRPRASAAERRWLASSVAVTTWAAASHRLKLWVQRGATRDRLRRALP